MDTLTFDLVTPQATFFSGHVRLVEAPGTLGDFGVLPGHMPFISTLKPGVVKIQDANNAESRLFVAGGIAEVNATHCTILAEQVVDLASFSRADAESRLLKARTAVTEVFDENAKLLAAREVEAAETLLAALS